MATIEATPLIHAPTAKACLEKSERLLAETGHYSGLTRLEARENDPLRYESLHAQLRSAVVAARETARRISASPAIREQAEFVVTLYTLEGDAIVLSTGIMVHVHTVSRFIKWMIRNDYETDPGVAPGDIFGNNDSFIGDVQPADMMDVIPLHVDGRLIGWIGAVSHVLDIGGVEPGGEVAIVSDRFGEGMFVTAEKIGSNDDLRRDYLIRCEKNLRMPIYWILDEKAKVSACQEVREKVLEMIERFGVDYYLRATREFIEENRRGHLERVKTTLVPGTYRGVSHYASLYEGQPGVLVKAAVDLLYALPLEMIVDADGRMRLDFDGAPGSGPHSANCTEAAMDGGLFITLTQLMDFDGKVNHGAWLGTDLVLPPGSLVNPTDETSATSTSWAVLIPAFALFQRLVSRGFFARGFREEIFLGGAATPFMEAGGQSQYGHQFGAGNFECAACGSGARGIMDGIDTGYAGWNPEGDMGSVEVWELEFPLLYLGRRNFIDSGGAGRFRGGVTYASVWKVHHSPEVLLSSKEHPGRVFDQSGIFGGYPAPTAQRHYAVRGSNLDALAAERKPLPHGISSDGESIDVVELVEGELEAVDGQYASAVFGEGDLYTHAYSSGGGYGDPLDREPQLVAQDVADDIVSPRAARAVYGVVLVGAETGEPTVDEDETALLREDLRRRRAAAAMPTREWIESERGRVARGDFIPPVREMYASAMRLSPRIAAELREFWSLDADWTLEL
jgi:acetone carboxylase, alpha subunit